MRAMWQFPWLLLLAVIAAVGIGDACRAADPPPEQRIRPNWQVGDRWLVETQALDSPVANPDAKTVATPITWRFTVAAREKIAGRDCFRLEAKPELDDGPQPLTTLWIDSQTYTLRQSRTEIPVQEELRAITEHYQFPEGQASPVFGPVTGLPVDLPIFSNLKPRAGGFEYVVSDGPAPGARNPDDLGFAVGVEQSLMPAKLDSVRTAMGAPASRDFGREPIYEIRMRGPERESRQLWQPGQPWPLFADNGQTRSRLIRQLPGE